MMAPTHPELRGYLLGLVREERALEALYRQSHSEAELRQIRREWKASYRSIRDAVTAEEARLIGLMHLHAALRCTCRRPQPYAWSAPGS